MARINWDIVNDEAVLGAIHVDHNFMFILHYRTKVVRESKSAQEKYTQVTALSRGSRLVYRINIIVDRNAQHIHTSHTHHTYHTYHTNTHTRCSHSPFFH